MRPGIIRTIYFKELRDALRDRRTLFMMIGLPMLLYPLLVIGAAKFQESQTEATEARASRVVLWGEAAPGLAAALAAHKIELVEQGRAPASLPAAAPVRREGDGDLPDSDWVRAARQITLERRAEAVLVLWPGFATAAQGEGAGQAWVLFDSVRPDSLKARQRASEALGKWRRDLLAQRERNRALPAGFTTGFEIRSENVAAAQRRGGMLLGMILCMVLILMSALSGFYAAIDLTAGEKERGTMQTLLCAPVTPDEIIAGKFLTVWTISFLAGFVNLASITATMTRLAWSFGEIRMTVEAFMLSLVVLAPISFTLSAIYLAVAAFARDFKEGQNLLTPVMIVLQLPLILISNPNVELNVYTMFVPVVNVALLIKALFLGEARADAVFLTLLSSAAYALLAILFAARVFQRETVLLGGREPVRSVLDLRREPGGTPTPALALVLFALVLVVNFYGQVFLAKASIPVLLLVVLYGFFLLPPLLAAAGMGFSFRRTFSLRRIGWAGLAGSVLVGLAGWTVASGVLIRLLPPPPSLIKALERILLIEDRQAGLGMLLALVALSPAICEEFFFRGFVLAGLRRLGPWPAVLGTALLFAVAHASIYRLLPTLFLGLLMTYAVWKTGSIAAGVVIHLLNNGTTVLLARGGWMKEFVDPKASFLPWTWTLAGALVVALGLWLLWRMPEPGRAGEPS